MREISKFFLTYFLQAVVFACLISGPVAHAHSQDDIQTSFPLNFGDMLIGGASLAPDSMVWAGNASPLVLSVWTNKVDFNVSGDIAGYTGAAVNSNQWVFDGSMAAIGKPNPLNQGSPASPPLDLHFAPTRAGALSATMTYLIQDSNVYITKPVSVQGRGIQDHDGLSGTPPYLTLEVSQQNADSNGVCVAGQALTECERLSVSPQGVIFTVTPRSSWPQADYLLFHLFVEESDTDCNLFGTSFSDNPGNIPNNSDPDNYFFHKNGTGMDPLTSCPRQYSFLISKDKTVQFPVMPRRSLSTGHVDYTFYIEGHWDQNNPSRWPGSHKTFRLTTSGAVTDNTPPTAEFTASPASGGAPLAVNLDASGSSDNETAAADLQYQWSLNPPVAGVTLPNGATGSITLPSANRYEINLTVRDEQGAIDSLTRVITVNANLDQPVASFSAYPTNGFAPLNVYLDASSSLGSHGGEIVNYQWDVTPGISGSLPTGATGNITLPEAVDYTISLTVTDDNGLTHSSSQLITVAEAGSNQPPVANFTITPESGDAPLKILLDASASTDDGTIMGYQWEISPETGGVDSQQTIGLTLREAGVYRITLTVTDNQGVSTTLVKEISVGDPGAGNQPPSASFKVSPGTGTAPLSVNLDASRSGDGEGPIADYIWRIEPEIEVNFPDGPIGNIQLPTAGHYTIYLTVTDREGLSDEDRQVVTVGSSNNQPPTAGFELSPARGIIPLTVNLNADESRDNEGSISYEWRIEPEIAVNFPPGARGNINISTPGEYTIYLTVRDEGGLSAEARQTVSVMLPDDQPPIARFTVSPESGVAPLDVVLNALGSTDEGGGTVVDYQWRLIDSPSAEIALPQGSPTGRISLPVAGAYTISLTVTDTEGLISQPVSRVISARQASLHPLGQGLLFDQSLRVHEIPDSVSFVEAHEFRGGVENLLTRELLPLDGIVGAGVPLEIRFTLPLVEGLAQYFSELDVIMVDFYAPPAEQRQVTDITERRMLTPGGEWLAWTGGMEQLQAFDRLPIADLPHLSPIAGMTSAKPGYYWVYAGYRIPLQDNSFFFVNLNPLSFQIQ